MKKLTMAVLATTLMLSACGAGDSEPAQHQVMGDYMLANIDATEAAEYCARIRLLGLTVREDNPKGVTMLQLQEKLEDIQQDGSVEVSSDVDLEEVYEYLMGGFTALCD